MTLSHITRALLAIALPSPALLVSACSSKSPGAEPPGTFDNFAGTSTIGGGRDAGGGGSAAELAAAGASNKAGNGGAAGTIRSGTAGMTSGGGQPNGGAGGTSGDNRAGGGNAPGGRSSGGRASAAGAGAGMTGGGAGAGVSNLPSAGGGGTASSDRAQEVCRRWSDDRADMSEGTWSGSVASCDAGDLGAPGRDNALRLVNLYRFLADMPAVAMDDGYNDAAQQCALLQSANNGLSHDPPTTWNCYTQAGADASSHSSISSGKGVHSIDGYMTDGAGNADTMGHRRWVFANQLGPVGFGSATASCFYQPAGNTNAKKAFVAWPPPGPVPLAAITTTKADTAGWTIQSDSVDLSTATVTVTDGDQMLPVTQATLPGGYGSRYALRIVPTGWTLVAGHSYLVTATGTSVSYTIEVVDCGS